MNPILGSLLGLGGQVGSGVLGEFLAGLSEQERSRLMESLRAEYDGLVPPEFAALAPEQMGPSAYAGVRPDAEAVAAQKAALAGLADLSDDGYGLDDRAAQTEALSRSSRAVAAQQQALRESLAARGQLGGGAELTLSLRNQQDAANRASNVGLQTAAEAQRRRYRAILDRGNLGGQVRGQDYAEKSRAASAADSIAEFNARMRQDAARYAQQMQQQTYQNRLGRIDRKAGVTRDRADDAQRRADGTRTFWGGVGQATARAGSTWDAYRDEEDWDGR